MEQTSTPQTSSERMTTVYSIFASGGEMGTLMRQIEWAQTPLGPVESWPQSLCTALSICLASRFPMLIWWGPKLVMLYNDAYRPMLGAVKHPTAMGQRGSECWTEIWDVIGPMLANVVTHGEATWSHDQLLLLERNGYVEECYFTFSYSPIRDESGVAGVFTAVTETTQQILSQRRLRILRELAARNAEAKSTEEACRIVIETLTTNSADLPCVLLYLCDKVSKKARFAGATGLTASSSNTPETKMLDEDALQEDQDTGYLVRVARSGNAILVENLAEHFPKLQAVSPLGIPLQEALFLPVAKSGQESLSGVLVVGVSPHCALDSEYRGFFELVAGQVAANIANARAYEAKQAHVAALAELDHAKTTFFSNISHEFRTPLTLLLAPIEDVLAAHTDLWNAEQRALLEIVYRNGRRLLKLVNTLLDFSRMEAGRMEAVYQPTDLARFTLELASSFRDLVEHVGLHFRVDCPPLAEPVYVARELWEKIVLNLLSNAFKFTFQGEIAVALRSTENYVTLTVSDTGIGIAANELPQIFERFHRIHGVQGRSFEGSGIGLSLVQELVHLHGGTIGVTSVSGVGTTFSVSLPLGKAHLPPEQICMDMAEQNADAFVDAMAYVEEARRWLAPETTLPAMALHDGQRTLTTLPTVGMEARILLVDDNADMRDYLVRLLRTHYRVETAADGKMGLQMVLANKPDLIISDSMMPVMDGLQFLQALRENKETHTIPVILLSARAGEKASVEGLQAGADDYLVKPFSARELLARVSSSLERTKMRLALAEQMRLHALHLQELANVSLVINSMRPVEEILSIVVAKARELIGVHQAMAALEATSEGVRATHMVSFSPQYARWREEEQFVGYPSLYARLRDSEAPLRLTASEMLAYPELRDLCEESVQHPPLHGLLGVVLRGHDQVALGVLVLSDKYEGEFVAEDEAILVQLAQISSIAITNVQLYQQARAAIIARDQLLSIVSHDLKNPLGTIKGYAQLLQRTLRRDVPEADRQIALGLERINATVTKMTMQVDELLDITHLQLNKKLELMRQTVDLVALLRQYVTEFQQTAQHHTLRLSTTYPFIPVSIDVARIERVLSNIVSNAIKYSPHAEYVDIILNYEEKEVLGEGGQHMERWAVLQVCDYGVGIPAADVPHIFEQFKRASNVIGTYRGMGIGLANVQQIVEQHDGKVAVHSVEGVGSTFTVYLPAEKRED